MAALDFLKRIVGGGNPAGASTPVNGGGGGGAGGQPVTGSPVVQGGMSPATAGSGPVQAIGGGGGYRDPGMARQPPSIPNMVKDWEMRKRMEADAQRQAEQDKKDDEQGEIIDINQKMNGGRW